MRKALTIIGLIALLAAAFYGGHQCSSPGDPRPLDTITIVKIIPGDSVPVPYPVYVPVPDSTLVMKVPENVDTDAILAEYFTMKIFADTLTDDTTYRVIIIDTLFRNTLRDREVLIQNLKPSVIYITQLTPQQPLKPEWYCGVMALANSEKVYLGSSMALETISGHIYEIGISRTLFEEDYLFLFSYKFRLIIPSINKKLLFFRN